MGQISDRAFQAASSYQLEAETLLQMKDYTGAMKSAWQGQLACKTAENHYGEVEAWLLVMKAAVQKMIADGKPLDKKNLDRVMRAGHEAKKIGQKMLDVTLPNAVYWHASVIAASGDHKEALEIIPEAIAMYKTLKELSGEANAQTLMGNCYLILGQIGEAMQAAQAAMQLFQEAEDPEGLQTAMPLLAQLGMGMGPAAPAGDAVPMMRPVSASAPRAASSVGPMSKDLAPKIDKVALKAQILKMAGNVVVDDAILSEDTPLMDAGIDSLSAVSFRNDLAKSFEVELPASLIFDYPDIGSITDYVFDLSTK